LDSSDSRRLSVSLVDVTNGHVEEFHAIATHLEALLIRKEYGRAEMIRDEGHPRRFYAVRYWNDATAAERCHADPEVQALTASLFRIARVTHVVNGVHKSTAMHLMRTKPAGRFSPANLFRPLALLVLPLAAGGCVHRTLEVESNPPGALVYLNGEEVGRTPMRKEFLWYGTYDVQLRKEGGVLIHGGIGGHAVVVGEGTLDLGD